MAAVGSIVVTSSDLGRDISKYSIAWTSDASGVVSGTPFDIRRGMLLGAEFIPGTGGTVPTDLYDLTLTDSNNADLLVGNGANLSATIPSRYAPQALIVFEGGPVTPVLANAGNAKTGTLVLMVGPV